MATILVVDDVAANRELLLTPLGGHGHRMLEAGDGRQALALVRSEHPDLVITDVLMPRMNGYELVRQLHADPATSAIPVVFYTATYGESEARWLAGSTAGRDVLTKPPEADEVLKVVGRALAGGPHPAALADAVERSPALSRQHLRLVTDALSETSDDLIAANARLRALINVGLELGSEREPGRLLEKVCAATRDLFGATYVTLGILDLTDRTVRRVVTCGSPTPNWINRGDGLSGLLAQVVAGQRTLRGENPDGDPVKLDLPASHPRVQSFLAAPIASPDHVYGWICFVGNEGRAFTEDDEHLVTALSGQVGRIYENSHFHDLAQARAAEVAVERDRARQYLDTAEVMLVAVDTAGRIRLVNRFGCGVLGWHADELLGRDWFETCMPARLRDSWKTKFEAVLDGGLPTGRNPVLTKSGGERLIEWRNTVLRDADGRVTGTLSSGTDITDRSALEAQMLHSQKVEAIGQLAGGIAHDFNNLLTVILGFTNLVLADVKPDDPRRADLMQIHQAGVRAAALTRQLLTFSRKQVIEPIRLDLNAVVTGMREMLGRLIGEDVTVTMALEPALGFVMADAGQMEQVVMNLVVNARDAMPAGGTLTIETAGVTFEAAHATRDGVLAPGSYVSLRITDTGTGISPAVQARLFEPFFTTKGPGKGTGLGLATVHGIVGRCCGGIDVDSTPGRGTTFTLFLPQTPSGTVAAAVKPPPGPQRAGTQLVLVVDDDKGICDLAGRLLRKLGYRVLAASSVAEAVEVFRANGAIDVVLTDVIMPGASGPDLVRQLVTERPDLRVIYMSGFAEDAIAHHGILDAGLVFLHKPFTADTLGAKIGEVLDQPLRPPER